MTTSGIEPATYRFVAQRLNHCATAVLIIDKEYQYIPGRRTGISLFYFIFFFPVLQGQNTWCMFDWYKRLRNSFGFYHISCFLSPQFCSFGAVAFQSEQAALNWPRPSLVEFRVHHACGLSYVTVELCPVVSSWNISTFVWNIFNSKKNWARYDQKCMSVCCM